MTTAVTFISHGSSMKEYKEFVTGMLDPIDTDQNVNVGFFSLIDPDIPTAIAEHIHNGADHIRLLPLFLGPGKHILTDIPKIVSELQKNYPKVTLVLENYLGQQKGYKEMLKKWLLG